MLADQSKIWARWAGLMCLTSVGCIHHQHKSIDKQPYASSQSSLQTKTPGFASKTHYIAVVNDPTHWPEKPSDDHVRSRFPQLFPNLAQRAQQTPNVQVGQPESVPAENSESVHVAVAGPETGPEKLSDVLEAPADKLKVVEAVVDKPDLVMNKSTWARLSQNSAGAISAVAALASMADRDPLPQPLSIPADTAKPVVMAREISNVEPVKTKLEAVVEKFVAESIKSETLVTQTNAEPNLPSNLPKLDWQNSSTELIAAKPAELAAVAQPEPVVAVNPPAVSSLPEVKPEPVVASKPAELVAVAQPEPVVAVNPPAVTALPEVKPEPVVVEKPAELVAIPQLKPEPMKTLVEVVPVLAKPLLAQDSSIVTDPPVVEPVARSPVPVKADSILPEVEAKLQVLENPPALPASELLGKVEKPVAPAEELGAIVVSDKSEPLSEPVAMPPIRPSQPAIPVLAVPAVEKTNLDYVADQPVLVEPSKPEEKLALANSDRKPVESEAKPIASESDARIPKTVQSSDSKSPVLPLGGGVEESVAASAAAKTKATLEASEPSLPPPAPELQNLVLPAIPGLPAESLENSVTPVVPAAAGGSEKSSGAVAETNPAGLPKIVEPPESETVEQVPEFKLPEPETKAGEASEESVPVLAPLQEDSDEGHDSSAMAPKAGRGRMTGELVSKLKVLNPFRLRLFASQGDDLPSQNTGARSLKSASRDLIAAKQKSLAKGNEAASALGPQVARPSEGSAEGAAPKLANVGLADVSGSPTKPSAASYASLVKPSPNSQSLASLPAIQFPAAYYGQSKQASNPWANQKIPAIELVGRPIPVQKERAATVQSSTPIVRPNLIIPPLDHSQDLAIVQTSLSSVRVKPESSSPVPASKPMDLWGKSSSGSWWARGSKRFSSLWNGQEEVVPYKRQDWAGRAAATEK